MKQRKLGRTNQQVSEVGIGTWGMGGMWGPRQDREAINTLIKAMELGVTFIDTAYAYGSGHSESLIASAFKEAKKSVFVATKVPPKNHRWPASHTVPLSETFPKSYIIEMTENSLKNLRTDCIDLQQLHVWSDSYLEDSSWLEAIELLKSQGKIKYFGVSINDHQPDSALKLVESGLIDSVQVIYNIFDQSPEEKLFSLCQKHDVAVIARVPFDEGSLTGTLTKETTFHKKDWRSHYFTPDRLIETCDRVEKLRFLIREEITSLAQAALKFCLSHSAVSTVIPGMRNEKHLISNCQASDGLLLKAKELKELKKHAWPRNFYPFQ